MVRQLEEEGFKRLKGGQLKAKDGYTYKISDFEQREDGYIYGPKVVMYKDQYGKTKEKAVLVK